MPLEDEMRNEIQKLEREITLIDEDLQKYSLKMTNLLNVKKRKEHDLKILQETFEIPTTSEDVQITLDDLFENKPMTRRSLKQ